MAVFRQSTSRADDPQLHTHVVISAKVQTPDGRWLALDALALKKHQQAFGYLYQSVLRAEVTARFGMVFEPIVNGQAEIAGLGDGLLEQFSKRAGEIGVEMGDKLAEFHTREGREPTTFEYAAMEREAAVDTRNRKTGLGVTDLRDTVASRGPLARCRPGHRCRVRGRLRPPTPTASRRRSPQARSSKHWRRGSRHGTASMSCASSATRCPHNRDTTPRHGRQLWMLRSTPCSPSVSISTRPTPQRTGAAMGGRCGSNRSPSNPPPPMSSPRRSTSSPSLSTPKHPSRHRRRRSSRVDSMTLSEPPRAPLLATTASSWSSDRRAPARPRCSKLPSPTSTTSIGCRGRVGADGTSRGGAEAGDRGGV